MAPEERRAALIAATIPLLREHGPDVSTRQIAHAAGVAEGTIFGVFSDKNTLLATALASALDPRPTLDAIAAIRGEFPRANVIVLTSYPGDARIMRALMLGATSYLLKSSSLDEIIRTIRASMAGRHVMDPDVAHDLAAYAGTELLTAKEIAVLALVAQGHGNKTIASELCVSEETVKSRMRNILSKLNARDRTHAVILAIQRGFLQP